MTDADEVTADDDMTDADDGHLDDLADDDADDLDDDDDHDDVNRVRAATSRDVLGYLVTSLVEDPSAVDVEIDDRGRRPTLNVQVGQGDMGRIIGRRGHIAQSIRRVTRAAAVKDGTEINIEFID